ncbi:hypothetical protein EVAR_9281_1 [Eumeta japonica]|uniref:Nucleic-acid-binding protein from transposon X-element n=1 Tax=Eumeta variegata TaxID=151549 RepID=A0A4C1TLW7_EUMVA|nr:hypothetical protein EVAR_9281_1 [Eumeta japonica]
MFQLLALWTLVQKLYQRARCVKCLDDHGTTACTHNKDRDGPPTCVLCKSAGHTANYLGCPRASKRKSIYKLINNTKAPPPIQTTPRRVPPCSITASLSYAKPTTDSRKDPLTNNAPKNTFTEDIKALMSMISIIDIGEIALLTKKFKDAANPMAKILLLTEHASLVKAFKNNKT